MPGPSIMVNTKIVAPASSKGESMQGELGTRWEERMGHPSRGIRHKKTSALLLSWDPDHDDLKVGGEVQKLQEVLKADYGFNVYNREFNTKKSPKQQALKHLSAFVEEEDAEQGLLIIYYAGHGYGDAEAKTGDICLAGKNVPLPRDESREVEEQRNKANSVVWSSVEYAIIDTKADVLLIFDCCNAGRLCLPYRAFGRSYFEFLGACGDNDTTMGPGPASFTRALTWALKELAKKDEAFSTSELKHKIKMHRRFPKDQCPVLSDRHLPGEHIVISRKGLGSQSATPAPSKSVRAKELQNKEYIDLRFHFEHKVLLEHFDHTAGILKDLMDSKHARWSRVAFIDKNSLMEKTALKWKEYTLSRRKSNSAASAPPPTYFDFQVASPEISRTLSPQIPAHPYTPIASATASRTSSVGPDWERATLVERRTEAHKRAVNDESIVYHISAIAELLRVSISVVVAWFARKVLFRSDYEPLLDTESQ